MTPIGIVATILGTILTLAIGAVAIALVDALRAYTAWRRGR